MMTATISSSVAITNATQTTISFTNFTYSPKTPWRCWRKRADGFSFYHTASRLVFRSAVHQSKHGCHEVPRWMSNQWTSCKSDITLTSIALQIQVHKCHDPCHSTSSETITNSMFPLMNSNTTLSFSNPISGHTMWSGITSATRCTELQNFLTDYVRSLVQCSCDKHGNFLRASHSSRSQKCSSSVVFKQCWIVHLLLQIPYLPPKDDFTIKITNLQKINNLITFAPPKSYKINNISLTSSIFYHSKRQKKLFEFRLIDNYKL